MESNTLTSTMDKVKSAWDGFDLQKWSTEVGGSPTVGDAIQAGIYFCVSFGIGYILKRHFKTIILSILLSAIIIKGMEYHRLIEIDWNATKELFGITPDKSDFITPTINSAIEWIKNNIIVSVASFVGFLLGCKLG